MYMYTRRYKCTYKHDIIMYFLYMMWNTIKRKVCLQLPRGIWSATRGLPWCRSLASSNPTTNDQNLLPKPVHNMPHTFDSSKSYSLLMYSHDCVKVFRGAYSELSVGREHIADVLGACSIMTVYGTESPTYMNTFALILPPTTHKHWQLTPTTTVGLNVKQTRETTT
jgi:hypothetical protein